MIMSIKYDKQSDDIAVKMNGINFSPSGRLDPSFLFPSMFFPRFIVVIVIVDQIQVFGWDSTCENKNTCMQR